MVEYKAGTSIHTSYAPGIILNAYEPSAAVTVVEATVDDAVSLREIVAPS